jgi:Dolichyl-phosphate-mannose-protein mannosyltransferase
MAAGAVQAPAAARAAGPGGGAVALAAAAAAGAAVLVRLVLVRYSFDVFGDEVIYTGFGRSVVLGGFPRNAEGPFFLHPPGFFYLEAGWIRLLGYPAGPLAQVGQLRLLNVLLAGATAAVLVLLATRAGSLRAGVAAGLLFAVDPFCIRQNDRVLLDTAMMLWLLLGYLVLASLIACPESGRARLRAVAAGLLLGAAWLTKDEAVLLGLLPVLAAAALGWGPRRALSLLTAGVTAAVYAGYVAVVAANGEGGTWWQAKTRGVRRLLGLVQITGFNSRFGPSLAGRLASETVYFGTTYLLLILAVPAVVLILRRGGPVGRMLGLVYLAAGAALGYALTLGTLEENELYILLVPSILLVPVGVTWWRRSRPRPAWAGAALIAGLALVLVLDLTTCLVWLLHPDDGYTRLSQYMAAHIPSGSTVTSVDDSPPQTRGTTYWLLGRRYQVGPWASPAAGAREQVRYVVIPWGEVDQGYSYLTPAQARALVRHGRVLFSVDERTYGDLALYQIPLVTPRRG